MDRTQISRFFLVIPPGLESLALEELQVKSRLLAEDSSLDYSGVNLQQAEVVSGGIELNLALKEGWILNNYLRIPTRILQRLERFRCRDYSQIKKKVSRWPWYQYLRDGEIRVHVSSHNSRLNMKKRLVSSVVEGIGEAKKRQAFRKPHLEIPQNIYIRIEADQATLSLDTSGEFLFRRGYKEYVTKAPMRETLASALYWLASAGQKVEPMAILDPMCGSGTLCLESLLFWKALKRRRFAYENFPQGPTQSSQAGFVDLKSSLSPPQVFMGDQDERALRAAQSNYLNLMGESPPGEALKLGDWREVWRGVEFPRPLVMLLNPPYNHRLSIQQDLLIEEMKEILKIVKPETFGLVWPGGVLPKLTGRWSRTVKTKNGGIPVVLGILKNEV